MKTYWEIREAFATMLRPTAAGFGGATFDVYKNPTSREISMLRKKKPEHGSGFHNILRGLLSDDGDYWAFSHHLLHDYAKSDLKASGKASGYLHPILIEYGPGSNEPKFITNPIAGAGDKAYFAAAAKAFPKAKITYGTG